MYTSCPSTHWPLLICFFFFNDTATTEIYTLSLHDALPIWTIIAVSTDPGIRDPAIACVPGLAVSPGGIITCVTTGRSEEHTSELQSRLHLVCRLLLEKKKTEIAIAKHVIIVNTASRDS